MSNLKTPCTAIQGILKNFFFKIKKIILNIYQIQNHLLPVNDDLGVEMPLESVELREILKYLLKCFLAETSSEVRRDQRSIGKFPSSRWRCGSELQMLSVFLFNRSFEIPELREEFVILGCNL